jgi:hypothetical protein
VVVRVVEVEQEVKVKEVDINNRDTVEVMGVKEEQEGVKVHKEVETKVRVTAEVNNSRDTVEVKGVETKVRVTVEDNSSRDTVANKEGVQGEEEIVVVVAFGM